MLVEPKSTGVRYCLKWKVLEPRIIVWGATRRVASSQLLLSALDHFPHSSGHHSWSSIIKSSFTIHTCSISSAQFNFLHADTLSPPDDH